MQHGVRKLHAEGSGAEHEAMKRQPCRLHYFLDRIRPKDDRPQQYFALCLHITVFITLELHQLLQAAKVE